MKEDHTGIGGAQGFFKYLERKRGKGRSVLFNLKSNIGVLTIGSIAKNLLVIILTSVLILSIVAETIPAAAATLKIVRYDFEDDREILFRDTMYVGESIDYDVKVNNTNYSGAQDQFTWKSSNTNVIRILNETVSVGAMSKGTATLSVKRTTSTGGSASQLLTAVQPVTSIITSKQNHIITQYTQYVNRDRANFC